MKQQDQKTFLTIGAFALAYFGIIRPILNKLGITNSAAQQLINNQSNLPNNLNPFSPLFYQTNEARNSRALLLTSETANKYADILYKAMGYISDDEAAVYSVFRALKTKSQVSFLCDVFQKKYSIDLLEFLKRGKNQYNAASGLNSDELKTVIDIVNSLPKYKK